MNVVVIWKHYQMCKYALGRNFIHKKDTLTFHSVVMLIPTNFTLKVWLIKRVVQITV